MRGKDDAELTESRNDSQYSKTHKALTFNESSKNKGKIVYGANQVY